MVRRALKWGAVAVQPARRPGGDPPATGIMHSMPAMTATSEGDVIPAFSNLLNIVGLFKNDFPLSKLLTGADSLYPQGQRRYLGFTKKRAFFREKF